MSYEARSKKFIGGKIFSDEFEREKKSAAENFANFSESSWKQDFLSFAQTYTHAHTRSLLSCTRYLKCDKACNFY